MEKTHGMICFYIQQKATTGPKACPFTGQTTKHQSSHPQITRLKLGS